MPSPSSTLSYTPLPVQASMDSLEGGYTAYGSFPLLGSPCNPWGDACGLFPLSGIDTSPAVYSFLLVEWTECSLGDQKKPMSFRRLRGVLIEADHVATTCSLVAVILFPWNMLTFKIDE